MKTERTLNKIYATVIALLMITVVLGSAWAVTRTITPTQDNADTFIRNSNGKYWTATAANIQIAIVDLYTSQGNGIVYLPPENFTITSTLWINCSSITIKGSGMGSQAAASLSNNGTVLWIGANLPNGVIRIGGTSAPWKFYQYNVFEDFSIAGNNARTYDTVGINLTDCTLPIVRDVSFINIKGCAIFTNNARGPLIEHCYFENCGETTTNEAYIEFTGDYDTTPNPIVTHCAFEPGFYCFINCSQYNSGDLWGSLRAIISDNFFEGNLSIWVGVIPAQITQITGNLFIMNCSLAWIHSPDYKARWSTISGNTFWTGGGGGTTTGYAQIHLVSCYDIRINDNLFYNSYNNGIFLNQNCHNITITENIFDAMCHGCGIYSQSEDTIISNNLFRNIPLVTGTFMSAVALAAPSRNTSILGNKITGCEIGLAITGSIDVVAMDNTFDNILLGSDWDIYGADADDSIRDNTGHLTETWGNTSIANNASITHGLGAAPTTVQLTCRNVNLTAFVTDLQATTFKVCLIDIHTGSPPGGSYYVHWYAKV